MESELSKEHELPQGHPQQSFEFPQGHPQWGSEPTEPSHARQDSHSRMEGSPSLRGCGGSLAPTRANDPPHADDADSHQVLLLLYPFQSDLRKVPKPALSTEQQPGVLLTWAANSISCSDLTLLLIHADICKSQSVCLLTCLGVVSSCCPRCGQYAEAVLCVSSMKLQGCPPMLITYWACPNLVLIANMP